jgi:hypothetical protein
MDEPSLLEARLAHIPPGALDFVPVAVKARRDGWSPAVQQGFTLALAAGLGVSGAARSVGRSRETAYRLRDRPGAESFAAAWDRALHFAGNRPPPPGASAWERGVEGILVPVLHRGKVVAWRRKYCDRTLGRLLASAHAASARSAPSFEHEDEKTADRVQLVTFGGNPAERGGR